MMTVCLLQNATQKSQKVFVHVQSEIAAHEVEEIGTPLTASFLCFKNKFNSCVGCF
jgi:DNA mismatch repair protein MutH